MTYAQEVFFSAPKYLLDKLQSIDVKSFKIALDLPFHANNLATYNEMDILPLELLREASSTKFVIKSQASKNSLIQSQKLLHY